MLQMQGRVWAEELRIWHTGITRRRQANFSCGVSALQSRDRWNTAITSARYMYCMQKAQRKKRIQPGTPAMQKLCDLAVQAMRFSTLRYVWGPAISAQEIALQMREMHVPTMRLWYTSTIKHQISEYQWENEGMEVSKMSKHMIEQYWVHMRKWSTTLENQAFRYRRAPLRVPSISISRCAFYQAFFCNSNFSPTPSSHVEWGPKHK